jgi:hypothetical protein
MLARARALKEDGGDIVIGLVETHGRRETEFLLKGQDILPRRKIKHCGMTIEEFDIDAALSRKPQFIVVDELAHTNAPDSRHPKRWQDVEELLGAGVNFGFNVRPRPLDFEFSVSFETGNSLPVSNETESFPTSGKNSFPFERRLPGLDIVVGDLLFPRADRFDSEFIEHAEHLCGYAIGHARKRAQAMGGER